MNKKIFKYRIYPNKSQEKLLVQSFGNVRFIYNKCLDIKSSAYKQDKTNISYNELSTFYLKQLKEEFTWLKLSPAQSLQSSLRNLDNAFQRFFKKQNGYPRFKNKFDKQSLAFPQYTFINWKNNKIRFLKLGEISAVLHRKFIGKIKTCHIIREKNGKYYATILVETDSKPLAKQQIDNLNQVSAIDLGLKYFLTDSNGNKIDNPKFLAKYIDQIKFYQQKLAKTKKGSNNRKKLQTKINKLFSKITKQRDNFLHQISAKIIRENQAIIIETLGVKELLQNSFSSISRNIGDVSWSKFISFLKYKSEWYGKTLVQIDRFEPSSKLCSCCGHKNQELLLKDRRWICDSCGTEHDRDINAAKNILEMGLKKIDREDLISQRLE